MSEMHDEDMDEDLDNDEDMDMEELRSVIILQVHLL